MEEDVGDGRMVVERCPTSGQRRGAVSPRAFPWRMEKRAQMLMSVGLGVDRACLPEGDEELRAPDRVSAETRRREKRRGTLRGVSITPIHARIGRRPNGVLEDAWRRDADVGCASRRRISPATALSRRRRRVPSVPRRDVARESRPDNREHGATRPVRLQELR